LMSGSPTHSVGPHLFKRLSYEPMRDVPPVAMVAAAPNLLVVNASLPVKSLDDLVRLAREKPGQLTYSSAGNGTSGHLAAELLKNMARIDMRHVPYKSGPEAVTGVLTGDVSFIFFTVPSLLPQVETGKLRALAITGAARSQLVANVPTVAEMGFPGFEVLAWYALFAPRETPKPVVARLSADIEKIVQLPDIRDKMIQLGAEPRYMSPEQLTAFVAVESPKWGQLIRESGGAID
jgi:tripartite-type tricarboxylate transporter receptor subunit TctC